MIRHVVIIGNGVAGFSAARRLRREGRDLTISIFSDEAHPFYLRSRLKDYVCGALGEYEMILESRNLYRREGLSLLLQTPVTAVDAANREVVLSGGERVHYDRLLLATGCSPKPLEVPGGELQGVFSLRTLADAEAIRQWAGKHRRAVILGEGIVSLQLAESLARLGADIEYLLLGDHFWPEVLDPAASAIFEELLKEHRIRVHKRARMVRILGEGGRVKAVELDGRMQLPCDMVGHGCGFRPNTQVLAGSGVACKDGVVVNSYLETNVEGVFAAGDVISMESGKDGQPLSHFRWQNSFKQGEIAALNILGRRRPVESFATGIETTFCDVGVAALGRGNLSEDRPAVRVEQARRGMNYRRLVFQDEMLVGAILIGDTEHAAILEDHIRKGTMRAELRGSLLPALLDDQPRLTEPLTAQCPICTDGVSLPRGTLVGSVFECASCSSPLRLTYSEGRLAVVPATA